MCLHFVLGAGVIRRHLRQIQWPTQCEAESPPVLYISADKVGKSLATRQEPEVVRLSVVNFLLSRAGLGIRAFFWVRIIAMQHSALTELLSMKPRGEKIAMLTAYDAVFARLLADAGVEALLVGDSLGMIVQGADDTLAVRLADTAYHVRCVRAGAPAAVVIGDMPFGTFQESPARAFANAAKLLAAGATMVKIEGGALLAETVAFLTARGVPVCAHVGLMPQQVRAQGGYRVQGRDKAAAAVRHDASAMQEAGASMIVLELIPAALAAQISGALRVPTIGIGSGSACDGQVLVTHDMLGLSGGARKRFVKNFMTSCGDARQAVADYIRAVKSGEFPAVENAF